MADLASFLADKRAVIRVELTQVLGSSPREQGAHMFVAHGGVFGTIGGGQLEYMAIDQARVLINQEGNHAHMDVPLGPEIGQCCGGRVEISLSRMSGDARAVAVSADLARIANLPCVYIFGAGHIGRALALAFSPLPVQPILVDGRAEELEKSNFTGRKVLTPLPEAEIRSAPNGAAYIIATHDHSLDFLLAREALARNDAEYVGMIGSKTKRASFVSWISDLAPEQSITRLICPMGATVSRDKRPDVIAAFIVAEVLIAIEKIDSIRGRMLCEERTIL